MIEKLKNLIIAYYRKYKAFPSSKWLSEKLEISMGKLKDMLDILCDEKFISLYKNKYYIPDEKLFQKKIKRVKKIQAAVSNLGEKIVKIVMFITSIGAIYISIYYSNFWLSNFLSSFNSLILSSIMVIYATFAPQGAILFFYDKKYIKSIVISFTAIIVIIFSIISTIAGQYNIKLVDVKTENIKNNEIEKNILSMDLLKSEEKSFVDSIKRKENEIKIHQEMMSQFRKEETENIEYKIELWKIGSTENDIKELEKMLITKREEIKTFLNEDLLQTKTPEKQDFYTWISGLLKISSSVVEFWLYMFPAIFVDIIAPFGMAVALGLSKRRKNV